jgi:hypothetical protein
MNLDLGAMDARLKVATLSVAWAGVDFTAPHRFFIKEGAVLKTDRHGLRKQVRDLTCFYSRMRICLSFLLMYFVVSTV